MKKLMLFTLSFLTTATLAGQSQNHDGRDPVRQAVPTSAQTTQENIDISRFDLLLGNWKYEQGGNTYEEHWQKTPPSSLSCRAVSTDKAGAVSTESFRIERINGTWTLSAVTGNSLPSQFYLKVAEKDRLSFESKEDAFPKRFNYTRKEDGTLLVWLEGKLNGRETKLEYPMKKINQKVR